MKEERDDEASPLRRVEDTLNRWKADFEHERDMILPGQEGKTYDGYLQKRAGG